MNERIRVKTPARFEPRQGVERRDWANRAGRIPAGASLLVLDVPRPMVGRTVYGSATARTGRFTAVLVEYERAWLRAMEGLKDAGAAYGAALRAEKGGRV